MTKAWLLPEVIDPSETTCVQIFVPKDDMHMQAFFGAIQQLGYWWNWERDDQKSGLAVSLVWQRQLDLVADTLGVGESCMIDCDEVEDCIEVSPTIIVIEGDVTNNETNITNNETNITEILESPPDGNVYEDPPAEGTEPDPTCGAVYFIVQELRVFIVDLEASDIDYPDVFSALLGWMQSPLPFTFGLLHSVLTAIFGGATSVLVDYDAQADDMREYLYCIGIDKETFSTFVRTLTGGDAIADYLDCVGLSAFQQWYSVGQADLSQDCTSFVCADIERLSGGGNADMASLPFGGLPPYDTPTATYDAGNDWYIGAGTVLGDWRLLMVTYTFASPTLINGAKISTRIHVTRTTPSAGLKIFADDVEIFEELNAVTGSPVDKVAVIGSMTVTVLRFRLQTSINAAPEGLSNLTRIEIDLA